MPEAPVATPARHGTHGRVLVVDLGEGASRVEAVDEAVYRQFLAGYGLGASSRPPTSTGSRRGGGTARRPWRSPSRWGRGEGDGRLAAGPLRGVTVPVEQLRRGYFAAMRWDPATGRLARARAEELGIAELLAGYLAA